MMTAFSIMPRLPVYWRLAQTALTPSAWLPFFSDRLDVITSSIPEQAASVHVHQVSSLLAMGAGCKKGETLGEHRSERCDFLQQY